jgi:hypothetical protein
MDGGSEAEGCASKRFISLSIRASARVQARPVLHADAADSSSEAGRSAADPAPPGQRTHVVPVSPDASDVGCDAPEVVPRLAVGGVAGREDLANLARHEELFELAREVVCAVRDVEISDYEDEHRCVVSRAGGGQRSVRSEGE